MQNPTKRRRGRFGRPRVLILTVAALILALPAAASAQSRLLIWRTPSHYMTPSQAAADVSPANLRGSGRGKLTSRVVLPAGYTTKHCWPVLYLLHGSGTPVEWTADALSAKIPAIIVLPGGGPSWFVNWWDGGLRRPGWESWILNELIPLMARRLPICHSRSDHSIAGLSMGAYGAIYIASQAPQYFGSAGSFDGTLNIERTEFAFGYTPFPLYWDWPGSFYANGHNPTDLAANLAHTRVLLEDGNGTLLPGDSSGGPEARIEELETLFQSEDFAKAARRAHVPLTDAVHPGIHDWFTWGYDLTQMIAWNPFKHVARAPSKWTYTTTATQGQAWGYRFRFASPPLALLKIVRSGSSLRLSGTGRLSLSTPSGRRYRGRLPFRIIRGRLKEGGSRGGTGTGAPQLRSISLRVLPRKPTFHNPLRISFVPPRTLGSSRRYQVTALSSITNCTNFLNHRLRGIRGRRVSVTLGPSLYVHNARWCGSPVMVAVAIVPTSSTPVTIGTYLASASVSLAP
jgi:S-formylglutathione hydrolase FrmB